MNWIVFGIAIYIIILIVICLRIIFETRSSTKALAYLFACIFFPVVGIIFYFTFGINYWKIKLYSKKTELNEKLLQQLYKSVPQYKSSIVPVEAASFNGHGELATMILKNIKSPLTRHNKVKLLINGEEKFPELLKCLEHAKHHIHMEYYIYEEDHIGTTIIELLIKKAKEGVQVRFIYDDFGSPTVKHKIEKRMREAGIEIHPFHKIHFYLLANRINYRNHRKIVVIDGWTAFTGGINVNDKYINHKKGQLYWRDTHLRIDGPGVYYLQYLFLADWVFCAPGKFSIQHLHFGQHEPHKDDTYLQIVGSGPDSVEPSVLFSILQSINLAKEEIYISTPYFIPGESVMDALRMAALSGLDVKLLVPGISDSVLVNLASKANYNELLKAGVEIYLYEKGFMHAKTMVVDKKWSIVGTANMDYRSFELNFEVNAIIYDEPFARKLTQVFFEDLKHAKKINPDKWYKRPKYYQLGERFARLFSPSL